MDQGGGGHGGGGADLRLTAPLGPGDGGPGGDDHAEAGGHIQGLNQGLLPGLEVPAIGQEHCGQNAAGPGGGGGDNALHAGVALPHAQGSGDYVGEQGAAQGIPALAVGGHSAAVAPHQAAVGAVALLVALIRLGHGLQHGGHSGPGDLGGDILPVAVGQLDIFPQGQIGLPAVLQHLVDGSKVNHCAASSFGV